MTRVERTADRPADALKPAEHQQPGFSRASGACFNSCSSCGASSQNSTFTTPTSLRRSGKTGSGTPTQLTFNQIHQRSGRTGAHGAGRSREACTDLQTDRQVDPAAEGGADSSGVEAQILKEFGEGLRQGRPGTLLSDHHAGPDPGQVQPSRLKRRKGQHQTFYEQFDQSLPGAGPSERPSAAPDF